MTSKAEAEQLLAELRQSETRWETNSEMIRGELATSELMRLKVKRQRVELEHQINNEGTNNEN